jgi:hypothetical protein
MGLPGLAPHGRLQQRDGGRNSGGAMPYRRSASRRRRFASRGSRDDEDTVGAGGRGSDAASASASVQQGKQGQFD